MNERVLDVRRFLHNIGHSKPIQILIDENLLQYETIWAAAGHPKTVFQMTPEEIGQDDKWKDNRGKRIIAREKKSWIFVSNSFSYG